MLKQRPLHPDPRTVLCRRVMMRLQSMEQHIPYETLILSGQDEECEVKSVTDWWQTISTHSNRRAAITDSHSGNERKRSGASTGQGTVHDSADGAKRVS